MNEKLKEFYYRDDIIIGSKQNFINTAKKTLNASTKEINAFLSSQEINQINKKPNKHTNLKITAPPRTFQIDIMFTQLVNLLKIFYQLLIYKVVNVGVMLFLLHQVKIY